jgi:hypothetical protein
VGWFRICIGLDSSCPPLWGANAGTIKNPLHKCKTHLNKSTSKLDYWTTAHHADCALPLRTRKHYLCHCIEFEYARCWKEYVLPPLHGPALTQKFYMKAVQGMGAGAITSSVQILLSDLVMLRERGTFSGLMGLWVILHIGCLGRY